jgi:outer membrane protein OmpA-like peptidoglycan-associated protein/type II secretory pathway component PulM
VTEAAVRSPDDGPDAGPAREAFTELRTLIVGPEQRQLRALQARLDDPGRQAQNVSDVLPEAVLLRKRDPHLTRALAPTIEEAITASVRKNPQPLADALFPVIGPAIRKAIAASLSSMLDSLNRTVEYSLSWRAIKWRFTALLTGRPFAEVVLLNTLVYRVEQILLIDRRSGLLLQHVSSDPQAVQDVDMVSGMLTAIRDFSRDSFRVGEDDALDTLRVGALSVWIEQGPYAILAAVIRGTPPPELRIALQEAIERVHGFYGDALRSFDGDTTAFDNVRPTLEDCLQSQYHQNAARSPRRLLWALGVLALVAIGAWLYVTVDRRARWNGYLDALRGEPGIVVLAGERSGGRYLVRGLRDPLARDPAALLPAHRLRPDRVTERWQLYQALDPPLVLERARRFLRPPDGVSLQYGNGVLTASGNAPAAWIVESARIAPALAGVARFDAAAAIAERSRAIAQALESIPILFERGTTKLIPDSERSLAAVVEHARMLAALAQLQERRVRFEIRGHADADGPVESNNPLSLRRAEYVRGVLAARDFPALDLRATGVGSGDPASTGATEHDKQQNRRVSFRVAPAAADGTFSR